MKNSEKTIMRIIIIFGIITTILLIMVILLDCFNITQYFPFNQLTNKYDWLSIIGAIIGGLIGAIGTYIGIQLTIKNEREESHNREINERKRTGYSYLTFTDSPVTIKISFDSELTGLLDKNQNLLIGENVDVVGANYFDIELNFQNLNNNYPTAVMIEELELVYGSKIIDNNKQYEKFLNLYGYQKGYKPITVKNTNVVAFKSLAMINQKQLNDLEKYLINSEFIDVIVSIKFINANGIITEGKYSANLIKKNNIKLGNERNRGSNKVKIFYGAVNTYLIVEDIDYMEEYNEKVFGK